MEVESTFDFLISFQMEFGGIGMGLGPEGSFIDANHLNKGIGMAVLDLQ